MSSLSTSSDYIEAARRIESEPSDHLRPVRLSLLSTFTADLLKPYLVAEGAVRGFRFHVSFGPFNQLEQQALGSELYRGNPDVVVLATRIEEMSPALMSDFVALGAERVRAEIAAVVGRIEGLVEAIRARSAAKIVVWNFPEPPRDAVGLSSTLLDVSPAAAIHQANEALAAIARARSDVFIFDCARLAAGVGLDRWCDQRMFYIGRIPFSQAAQKAIGQRMARVIRAAFRPRAKCLVLDLDNTLWGGVIGEDGLGGIQLGEDFPGNVYKDFQRYVRSLKQRGVLLAIASKNNEVDAMEVLEKHADMVLRPDDFSVACINWNDKATSLRTIAERLNIGTDALVFFDDNPVERQWIRSQMPEVHVVEVPKHAIEYIDALDRSELFDELVIVAEDLRKADQYREQFQREHLQARSASVEEFLRELGTVVTIGSVGPETLPRFAQLLGKTNQFNLTTRRHSAAEIEKMVSEGGLALWLRAKDRYGDNGLVGAAIVLPAEGRLWRIDTLLMSCRVIGRQVETALLSAIGQLVRTRGGMALEGEYIPTRKNGMVSDLFRDHGFKEAGGNRWLFDLASGNIEAPTSIEMTIEEKFVGQSAEADQGSIARPRLGGERPAS